MAGRAGKRPAARTKPMTPRTLEPVRIYCVAVAVVGLALLATLLVASPADIDESVELASNWFVARAV